MDVCVSVMDSKRGAVRGSLLSVWERECYLELSPLEILFLIITSKWMHLLILKILHSVKKTVSLSCSVLKPLSECCFAWCCQATQLYSVSGTIFYLWHLKVTSKLIVFKKRATYFLKFIFCVWYVVWFKWWKLFLKDLRYAPSYSKEPLPHTAKNPSPPALGSLQPVRHLFQSWDIQLVRYQPLHFCHYWLKSSQISVVYMSQYPKSQVASWLYNLCSKPLSSV